MQQPTGNPAMAGGIILLVCGALILFGTVTRSWFTYGDRGFKAGTGLMGYYACMEGRPCEGKWIEVKSKGEKADFTAARFGGFATGLGAAVLAILCGAMALGRKARSAPLIVLYIFAGIAAAAGFYYVARMFSLFKGEMKPDLGYSFFLYVIGLVGAFVAGAAMVGPAGKKERGGGQPMMVMMQQPMQPQMGQPCPRCGQPLQFVAQYQRWFCPRCQQYV